MNSNKISIIFGLIVMILFSSFAVNASGPDKEEGVNVKEIMFHHLGDGYGWEVPFSHVYRIPLPVIVRAEDGKWICFSSSKLTKLEEEIDPKSGKNKLEAVPQIVNIEKDGKNYSFVLAHYSAHSNKIVQIFPVESDNDKSVLKAASEIASEGEYGVDRIIDGYVLVDGQYFKEYRPLDFSITKNVLALFIAAIIVTAMVMSVVRWYAKKGLKAPRKGMGFMEMLIDFIYTGVIKSSLHDKAKQFAPFLLTCFFFILVMNLVGLIVIFPGGANLTGNIAVTLVLAVLVFIVINIKATKHYWKEIFWPDVPLFLKFPLPIMQCIEIFGIFTKPAALCVRLFANMMGGHMIVITLTLLIFIFTAFGAAATGGSVVISIIFSIFMLALDILVSFIQAYVFTLLATLFIAMAQDNGHHEKHQEHVDHEILPDPDNDEKKDDASGVIA